MQINDFKEKGIMEVSSATQNSTSQYASPETQSNQQGDAAKQANPQPPIKAPEPENKSPDTPGLVPRSKMTPAEFMDWLVGDPKPDPVTPVHLRTVDASSGNTALPTYTVGRNRVNETYVAGSENETIPAQTGPSIYKMDAALTRPGTKDQENVYMNMGRQTSGTASGATFAGFTPEQKTQLEAAYKRLPGLIQSSIDDLDKNGANSTAFKRWFGGEHSEDKLGDNLDKVRNTLNNMKATIKNENFTFTMQKEMDDPWAQKESGNHSASGHTERYKFGDDSGRFKIYPSAFNPMDLNGKVNPVTIILRASLPPSSANCATSATRTTKKTARKPP